MYNAKDQEDQIPRYYEIVKKEKYSTIYCVYLPLTPYKHPDKSTWGNLVKASDSKLSLMMKELEDSYIHLPAFSIEKDTITLNKDCLQKVISKLESSLNARNINLEIANILFTLKQYSQIIEMSANKELDLGLSGDLINILIENNKVSFENIKKLITAYKRIPEYLAKQTPELDKLNQFYNKEPLIWESDKRKNEWAFKLENPKSNNIPPVIRFSFQENSYRIHLWANKEGSNCEKKLEIIEKFLENWQDEDTPDEVKFRKSEKPYIEYVNKFKPDKFLAMKSFIKTKLVKRLKDYS